MGVSDLVGDDVRSNRYLTDRHRRNEPAIGPGQIRVVECEAASLSAFHAELLRWASVVLYDRALVNAVAEALPIGVYAEPLPATISAGPAIAPRAMEFAADGWGVLQLIERRVGRRQRLLRLVTEGSSRTSGINAPLLAVGTISAARYRHRGDTAKDLAIAAELGADELLSLTFAYPNAPVAAASGPYCPVGDRVFTANGLAG
ncbi:MAG: hypothetical protein AB7H71_10985 [Alphaproteobacteria bacterium]